LILMLTSKGMAGVPRASLVVIAATLNQFNIPEAGLLLILGIDTFLDMGRSATNAVGNSIPAPGGAKWEGGLLPPAEAGPLRPPSPRTPERPVKVLVGFFALCLAVASGPAAGQVESAAPAELTGTLAKARSSGAVTIAYRETSVPFSYLSRGQPVGYSIELCRKLVEAMGEAVGRELEIRWIAVTPETRVHSIASRRADRECGSTTSTLERRKLVAFSPTIFVSGTKLMVRKDSPIRSFRDLGGKTVVVTGGTTNEAAMSDLARKFRLDFRLVAVRD